MMRWDGTRQGIQEICAWANAADDGEFDEPPVMYEFTGPADVQRVTVATDDGDYTEMHAGDQILKTDDGFRVERRQS